MTCRVFEMAHVGGDHLERARARQRQAMLMLLYNLVLVVEHPAPQSTSSLCDGCSAASINTTTGCSKDFFSDSTSGYSSSYTIVVVAVGNTAAIDHAAAAAADGNTTETAQRETSSYLRMHEEKYNLDRAKDDNEDEHRRDKPLLSGCRQGAAFLPPDSLAVVVVVVVTPPRCVRCATGRLFAVGSHRATALVGSRFRGWF